MKKIMTVIGARPQFIKCAPVSKVLRQKFTEILVHTGQHYDSNMSDVFFDQLKIPLPDVNLGIGSSTHAVQTANMMIKLEEIALREKPDAVLVYGDTNSTLAGALVASKLLIPLVHIEAGLRSFNKKMPEEINRICTDHLSAYLFCPTDVAVQNLKHEGVTQGVHMVGDVMKDAVLQAKALISVENVLRKRDIPPGGRYYFCTIHRQENTDDIGRLKRILDFIGRSKSTVLLPIHPRTKKIIEQSQLTLSATIRLLEPAGYLESLALQMGASIIITDSGGIQKEAYILRKPCITLRSETEWTETVSEGANTLVSDDAGLFASAEKKYLDSPINGSFAMYGDGTASEKTIQILNKLL